MGCCAFHLSAGWCCSCVRASNLTKNKPKRKMCHSRMQDEHVPNASLPVDAVSFFRPDMRRWVFSCRDLPLQILWECCCHVHNINWRTMRFEERVYFVIHRGKYRFVIIWCNKTDERWIDFLWIAYASFRPTAQSIILVVWNQMSG